MSLDQEVDILRKIPLFADVDPPKLKLMAFASERLTFKPGEAVVRQGDPGDAAYVIIAGTADVVVKTPSGPLTVASMECNDIVGDIAILIDVPRTATVTARGELITLKLTKDLFFQLVNDFPEMAVEVMRVLATRLEQTTAALREARAGNGAA